MRNPEEVTVLLVEDEVLIRMEAEYVLEDQGYKVLPATNAAEALEILDKVPKVDVLFTDVKMPGPMDGLDLAWMVHERWPWIRLIIASGHADLTEADLPNDGKFFRKPYSGAAITNTIQNMVSG